MVPIIRPHGAIADRLAKKVAREKSDLFAVIDIHGNRYGIEEETFNLLKERGVEEYEIK